MWFDSHCHLQICEERDALDAVVARAQAAGVTRMLTAAVDLASSRRVLDIAAGDGVYAAVGVHPNSARDWGPDAHAQIEEMLSHEAVVAVGESGLDFYRDDAPPNAQFDAFGAHVDLAVAHDKALIVHTRRSLDEALDLLGERGPPERFVFHCWSGDEARLRRALDLGAYVSFAGNITFRSAGDLRSVARAVPSDRLLVETDSPYLAPAPNRGRPNEPANVTFVGAALADVRDEDVRSLAEATFANACALFALDRQ